ncbi:ribonuclease G [Uliginosibacterium sp. 31-16]|uniref:ribonuclease G n=1 Tax=Uliginosibacterium sp. 31-16 TaxID=3068315 RepID=UPI00273D91D0|nr:ribonuclease G [Uliginosibacterium sp. 31-16]MDP5238556.1 ribonuclease G [Uliginosibacterium sp. 31-16]
MSEAYLINFTPQETRVALLYNGVVQELHIEREHSRGFVGNIYLGKVVRVLPGMQSAFIDIGLERTAFLHVADIWLDRAAGEAQRPIERILNEGQSLIVQVLKDPIGSKGARLSTQISIAGRLLVYLPQDKHIGISQRIESEAGREALRARVQGLLPVEEKGGFIVRTQAEQAGDEELAADIAYLSKSWAEIQQKRMDGKPPTLLYRDLNLAQRVLRDLIGADTEKVVIDSRENFQKLCQFAADYMPRVAGLLDHYSGERPLFDLHGVEDEIQKALARRVDLKSGGYLIIDQTEALCTIDVNTGGFVGARTFDDTIFKTNLEAAQAIARQLRLRNLGGIILLDFIDMENEEHRLSVLAELTKALVRDHTKVSVGGFTSLGLVEMTRKRTRESLAHVLCEACPTCGGRGEVKTARTVAYEVMREVVREARQFTAKEFRILAAPSVVNLFHDEEAQAIANLQDFIGKPISFHAESSYTPEQFDIVLL